EPDGILRSVNRPHGSCFTTNGRFICVADAGAPYVHIYRKDAAGWEGVRRPCKSIRVLTNEDFLRGEADHNSPSGPQGIDIDNCMSTLVTTCEAQPLVFFDLSRILEGLLSPVGSSHSSPGETLDPADDDRRRFELKYELDLLKRREYELKEQAAIFENSWSR